MANEIQTIHDDAAETVYALVRNMAGQFYAGATPETFTVANWATYDIALAEVDAAGSGTVALHGTFPAVAAGFFWVDFYVQAGGAPASTDSHLKSILFFWNATTLIPAEAIVGAPAGASVSVDVAAVKAETALIVEDTGELQTDWANGGRLDLILDAAVATANITFSDKVVSIK